MVLVDLDGQDCTKYRSKNRAANIDHKTVRRSGLFRREPLDQWTVAPSLAAPKAHEFPQGERLGGTKQVPIG